MKKLTSAGMLQLQKLHKDMVPPCPLFAVEYNHEGPWVLITNGQVALAWPRTKVDTECARYARLLAGQKDKMAKGHVRALCTGYWGTFLFYEKGTMKPAIEGEPEQLGKHAGEMVYTTTKGSKFYYSPSYIEMVEDFVEDPALMLYWAPKSQNLDRDLRTMAVYDGDQLVGAVANIRE